MPSSYSFLHLSPSLIAFSRGTYSILPFPLLLEMAWNLALFAGLQMSWSLKLLRSGSKNYSMCQAGPVWCVPAQIPHSTCASCMCSPPSHSGYCHQQGQAINADTLMAFLFTFDIPCYLSRGLTCDLIWLLVLISGNGPNPGKNEREKTHKETIFLGFVPSESILGCIWTLHLGRGFFCLFSLQDKQNSHKTYKENKMFYFFLFWGRQRGKQEENSIFFIKQQKYQPKEKDIQHCVWKICKNSKGVTILLILSHLYTNTYKTWMNNRGNIFLNKKIKTQAFNTYPRKTSSFT